MKVTRNNIIYGILFVFIVWICSGILIYKCIAPNERGTFGDMFGAVNALFSGLALFGIIISILIQQNELNLQRKELADTREEFKINRITNVLFKQVEYLNHVIDDSKFEIKDYEKDANKLVSIDEFIRVLDRLKKIDNTTARGNYLRYLKRNDSSIIKLLTKIKSSFTSFEDFLIDVHLSKSESVQMKKMLSNNVQSTYIDLIVHKKDNMQKVKSTDKMLIEVEKKLLDFEKNLLMYLLEFGKNTTPKSV